MPDFETKNAESQKYGLHIKKDAQLEDLKKLYPEKIQKFQDRIVLFQNSIIGGTTVDKVWKIVEILGLVFCLNKQLSELEAFVNDDISLLGNEISRLVDKNRCTLQEIDLREQKLVERKPVGTIYYIDLDNGDDGKDGLTKENAWKTIEKYVTGTIRTAGDIGKVRANTSEIPAGIINFDEDGHKDNGLITIKGCDSVDDPWGDASDIRPIIDWNDTTDYYLYHQGDNFWKIQNLDFKGGNHANGPYYLNQSTYIFFDNCRFYENGAVGLHIRDTSKTEVRDCEFWSNIGNNVKHQTYAENIMYIGCIFNGGADGTVNGINYAGNFNPMIFIDCEFGQTTAHSGVDIQYGPGGFYFRNCKYNSLGIGQFAGPAKRECIEDENQVFEAHKVITYWGTLERDTSVVRSGGGANSSLKMTPTIDTVGKYSPINSSGINANIVMGAFKVWLESGVEKTITMYIKGFGWTTFPDAEQLLLRASYLSNGANANRSEIDSDEVISDNITWEPFQITLTPSRTGFVYLDVFLGRYEAGCGVNVSNEPPGIS